MPIERNSPRTTYTGGPAFPTLHYHDGDPTPSTVRGMTLRDYFAAAVVTGAASHDFRTDDDFARYAYELADALVAERDAVRRPPRRRGGKGGR
jgi:hypothetical protein